eukprot:665922-Rhodomonas_salina.1
MDWSKINLNKAQLAGAGIITLPPLDATDNASPPCVSTRYYKVGGMATNTRAELAAMTSALGHATHYLHRLHGCHQHDCKMETRRETTPHGRRIPPRHHDSCYPRPPHQAR